MNGKQIWIWLAASCFVLAVFLASVFELIRSYRTEFRVAYTEADLSGYLVSEWISESFSGIEYVLKDALYGFDETNILSKSRESGENALINERLVHKASYHDNIIFLGVFDRSCVIQHGSIYSIIGDSSADLGRAYCKDVLTPPVKQMKFSGFFVSSTGDMNVSATYPLLGGNDRVVGFSLAALDLSFFQRWLDSVINPAITISIMDENQVLLARKPMSNKLGQKVEDTALATFFKSGDEAISFRRESPVDGVERLWSIRKIQNLPFVVAVGYALDDVLASWNAKVLMYAVGNALMAVFSFFLAFTYQKNSRNAAYMETLAMVDPLTGLLNRRSFGKIVKSRVEKAAAENKAMSFIMIDVDHFKAINDTYGHEKGDEVLQKIAEDLKASFRSTDIISRWGGEEFLVYLSDADLEAAKRLAARLQAHMSETTVLEHLTVSVSQGISTWTPGDTFDSAIKRADALLYKAKNSGRNCFCHG